MCLWQPVLRGIVIDFDRRGMSLVDLPFRAMSLAPCESGEMVGSETCLRPWIGAQGSFRNWFRDRCDETGLASLSAHGLRRSAVTPAAEACATTHRLMEIMEWTDLTEAQRYTAAAERNRPARAGMVHVPQGYVRDTSVPLFRRWDKSTIFSCEINAIVLQWRAGQDETANSYVIEVMI